MKLSTPGLLTYVRATITARERAAKTAHDRALAQHALAVREHEDYRQQLAETLREAADELEQHDLTWEGWRELCAANDLVPSADRHGWHGRYALETLLQRTPVPPTKQDAQLDDLRALRAVLEVTPDAEVSTHALEKMGFVRGLYKFFVEAAQATTVRDQNEATEDEDRVA